MKTEKQEVTSVDIYDITLNNDLSFRRQRVSVLRYKIFIP